MGASRPIACRAACFPGSVPPALEAARKACAESCGRRVVANAPSLLAVPPARCLPAACAVFSRRAEPWLHARPTAADAEVAGTCSDPTSPNRFLATWLDAVASALPGPSPHAPPTPAPVVVCAAQTAARDSCRTCKTLVRATAASRLGRRRRVAFARRLFVEHAKSLPFDPSSRCQMQAKLSVSASRPFFCVASSPSNSYLYPPPLQHSCNTHSTPPRLRVFELCSRSSLVQRSTGTVLVSSKLAHTLLFNRQL